MKQNLYAVAVMSPRAGNLINQMVGYRGATSMAEAKGMALECQTQSIPDATGHHGAALEIPVSEIRKIIAQHEEATRTHKCSDQTVTFKTDQATRDAVFEKVVAFFLEQESFSGEALQQNDDPQIAAPGLLGEIADQLMGLSSLTENDL